MAIASNQIDDIRRQMAQIRRELHEDVQGVVAGAEAAADWRRYVRLYPWAAAGLAFGAGYLLAPRRRRASVAEQVVESIPDQVKAAVQEVKEEIQSPAKKEKRAGLAGLVFGLLAPIATRAAQNYAMHFLEQWIAQQGAAGGAGSPLAFLQGIPGMPNLAGQPAAPRPPGPPGHSGPSHRPTPPAF